MSEKKQPWIILMTHGKAGEELKKGAEMIAGELKDVYCLSLMEGMDPQDFIGDLKQLLDQAPENTIILTDIFGGTPSNTAAVFATQKEYTVLSGVNLAMLIEAEMQRSMLNGKELADDIEEAGKTGIRNIRKVMEERRK